MLAGLGHHRVVGRDDQHGQVEPRRPGQHVADEPLVARDVDQGQAAVAQVERGEAQVDRDPALLLGREAVGVDAGQGPDQRRLAVVDVPGRPEDQVALSGHAPIMGDRGRDGQWPVARGQTNLRAILPSFPFGSFGRGPGVGSWPAVRSGRHLTQLPFRFIRQKL